MGNPVEARVWGEERGDKQTSHLEAAKTGLACSQLHSCLLPLDWTSLWSQEQQAERKDTLGGSEGRCRLLGEGSSDCAPTKRR